MKNLTINEIKYTIECELDALENVIRSIEKIEEDLKNAGSHNCFIMDNSFVEFSNTVRMQAFLAQEKLQKLQDFLKIA